jgi:hypothetical protein
MFGGELQDLGGPTEELAEMFQFLTTKFPGNFLFRGGHAPALQIFRPPPGVAATGAAMICV